MNQVFTLRNFCKAKSTVAPLTEPPKMHLLPGKNPLLFLVERSQLFEIDEELFTELSEGKTRIEDELPSTCSSQPMPPVDSKNLAPPTALSLNIAQACNLSCTYCYADEGKFHGSAKLMSRATAERAIDQLIANANGRRVTVGFIGGEAFLNRDLLHHCVRYAGAKGAEYGSAVSFSVTTNATLLTEADLSLLHDHTFAVTVSLDGGADLNNRYRRARNGGDAFQASVRALQPLLDNPGRARIAARATIARENLQVLERIDALAQAGFHDIGVSPLRTSPDPALILQGKDWDIFLDEMIRAGDSEWARTKQGAMWRFSNFAIALKQIHSGACQPLPCGSGTNYLSVGADGAYYSCHRTVNDAHFRMGDVWEGISQSERAAFVATRQVDLQEPCRGCWARYLCGGGCHAEVALSGRSGCDYIRGWLEYCLKRYVDVLHECPSLLEREGVK